MTAATLRDGFDMGWDETSKGVFRSYADLLAERRRRGLNNQEEQQLELLRERVTEIASGSKLQGRVVAIDLDNADLAGALLELVASHAIVGATGSAAGAHSGVAVVDAAAARGLRSRGGDVAIVLVNVSGPDALVGALHRLAPAAFVPRPASADAVFEAVIRVLGSR